MISSDNSINRNFEIMCNPNGRTPAVVPTIRQNENVTIIYETSILNLINRYKDCINAATKGNETTIEFYAPKSTIPLYFELLLPVWQKDQGPVSVKRNIFIIPRPFTNKPIPNFSIYAFSKRNDETPDEYLNELLALEEAPRVRAEYTKPGFSHKMERFSSRLAMQRNDANLFTADQRAEMKILAENRITQLES